MKKLRSLQVMRAVAVIGVVLVHTTKGAFSAGGAGVDLFFVISGFIMAQVSQGRDRSEFISARLWRIFPLYFVCAAMWWAAFGSDPGVKHSFCRDMASVTLWPVWGERCQPYLRQAWSLSYELLFYGLVALCIKRTNWLFVILPALVVLFLVFPSSPTIRFLGWPYLLEFLAGFLIAKLPLHYSRHWLILGALLVFLAPVDIHGPWRALWWGAPSIMIVYGALGLEQQFQRKAFDLPVWLGDASYSIYLGHTLFIFTPVPGWFLPFVVVAASCLIYQFVELPILKLKSRRGPKPHLPDKDVILAADPANSIQPSRPG